jgi:hypothetical protein
MSSFKLIRACYFRHQTKVLVGVLCEQRVESFFLVAAEVDLNCFDVLRLEGDAQVRILAPARWIARLSRLPRWFQSCGVVAVLIHRSRRAHVPTAPAG